jgi:hypothetical protein
LPRAGRRRNVLPVKRHAPATARNRTPLLDVLRRVLPPEGKVLEIASGTGEHAVFFAEALPALRWQPTDVSSDALASIDAHRGAVFSPRGTPVPSNVLPAVALDVRDEDWGEAALGIAAMVCINMIHIAPWSCAEALLRGAARHLPAGAPLVLYGPYRFDGVFTAPSNEMFDASLRNEDPSWGVRDLSDVTRAALACGLTRTEVIEMPANNHVIVFRRDP